MITAIIPIARFDPTKMYLGGVVVMVVVVLGVWVCVGVWGAVRYRHKRANEYPAQESNVQQGTSGITTTTAQ